MNILDYMKLGLVCLDGGMGTMLQKSGLLPGDIFKGQQQICNLFKSFYTNCDVV